MVITYHKKKIWPSKRAAILNIIADSEEQRLARGSCYLQLKSSIKVQVTYVKNDVIKRLANLVPRVRREPWERG